MMRFLYLGVKNGPKDPGQLASTSKGSFKTKTKKSSHFYSFCTTRKVEILLKKWSLFIKKIKKKKK